eukprot:CAMPEP_0206059546 /NCGR_PEP_ID=MMETSP1466-20131121/49305_1 /ASSEMBLY_ACC=CAM_ASM_001126 /TAXON_ID=44452 /ORGANISM="Pavlova gyrans, Strain CCMP608" /LENGTH=60 /DNA_ID=CAMNT_0053434871 /DNA_START=1 /DNA_END=179 /DNA_ORIENTATION=-
MYATMRTSPLFPSDTFDVTFYASTASFALNIWGIDVRYDSAVLSVDATIGSANYGTPVVT